MDAAVDAWPCAPSALDLPARRATSLPAPRPMTALRRDGCADLTHVGEHLKAGVRLPGFYHPAALAECIGVPIRKSTTQVAPTLVRPP